MSFETEDINERINIRELAECAGAEFRGMRSNCVIHGGDNHQAFELWDGGKKFTCHTNEDCNRYGHDGIGFLRALHGWTMTEVKANYGTPQPVDPLEAARRAAENARRIERELQEKIEQAQKAIEDLRKARRWIEDHDSMQAEQIAMWEQRGIPRDWQNYYQFGYRDSFTYWCGGISYSSPTLTIPIFEPRADEPSNIRHRILNPVDPKDKYRPERTGIEAMAFMGDRDLPLIAADRVIVVEGEIKAAVTFMTLDHNLWQVVGIPGKQIWGKLAEKLDKRPETVIMLDPDAKVDAVKMARSIGGAKVVDLPGKVDDMIIENDLDGEWLENVFHNARMVK